MSDQDRWRPNSGQEHQESFAHIATFWAAEAERWINRNTHPLLAYSKQRREAIEKALPRFEEELARAQNILDIGSGGGLKIYFPEIDTTKITAMDVCNDMLQGNPSVRRELADARERFPFTDESFDFVTQMFLNRYLEDQKLNVQEIVRVLKSGGRFLMLDHTKFYHKQEVAEFEPHKLQDAMSMSCEYFEIAELAPQLNDPDGKFYRGPLYLFTGIKK